jgi:uncharacterized protein (DUF697 family)
VAALGTWKAMAIKLLTEIKKSIEQLNPAEVVEESARPVHVMLRASSEPMYAFLEYFLVPAGPSSPAASLLFREGGGTKPDGFDLTIVEAGLAVPPGGFLFDEENPEPMLRAIIAKRPELALSLARTFPAFRAIVGESIVHKVAKENALFAIATALPNIAPAFALLPWAIPEAASDTAVLTLNQVKMAFLLGAAHGKPVGYGDQKGEIAAIVAGAFGWRTLARELVGKLPFGAGLVPKAAVAYAATWVEGRSLARLYEKGIAFSRGERRTATKVAMAKGREVAQAFVDAYRRSHDGSAYRPAR